MRMATGLLLVALACTASAFDRTVINDDNPFSSEPGMKAGKFRKGVNPEGGPDPDFPRPELFLDVLPPKWTPGDVLGKTDHSSVDKALSDVLRAGGIMNDRRCAVGVVNPSALTLSNPRWFMESGMIYSSAPYEIKQAETGLNLFIKKDWQATGSVGIMTYDIDGTDFKVAIMWSVPFDWNIYDVWFNMKVYPKSYPTGDHMYNQMYYYAGPWRAEGWETRNEYGVKLRGSMTKHIQSKLSVWVDTSGLDPEGPTESYHDCAYHGTWVGNYCWRDCTRGYCWINKKCSHGHDCRGAEDLPCYEECKGTS